MITTPEDLRRFVASVPARIRRNGICPAPPGSGESGHDQIALAIHNWLPVHSKGILHAEGLSKHIPPIPPVPRRYRGDFFGSWNSPDIALILPKYAVAIEVDRARGRGGASIRTAMTKASFSVLTGGFQEALVLIFGPPACDFRNNRNPKMRQVLRRFRTQFRTEVQYVITRG